MTEGNKDLEREHPVYREIEKQRAKRKPKKDWKINDASQFMEKRFEKQKNNGKLVRIGERVWVLKDENAE